MSLKSEHARFIIHHAAPGFGDSLITLCAAYDYAVQFKIPLIIDWRNSRWLSHKRKIAASSKDIPNLFETLFDNRNTLGGVRIITDPEQIHKIIPDEELMDIINVPQPLTGEIKKLYGDGREEILPRNYDSRIWRERKDLVRSLKVSGVFASKANDFLKIYHKKKMAVINIRIGNGEFSALKKADMSRSAAKAFELIRSIDAINKDKFFLYVASDTSEMMDYIRKEFPDFEIVRFSGLRPPQSTTTCHLYVDENTAAKDAEALLETSFVEMIILSRAKYLIGISSLSWISGYTYYARNFIQAENCRYRQVLCPAG